MTTILRTPPLWNLSLPGAPKFGPTTSPAPSSLVETAIIVLVSGAWLFLLTLPAFDTFFYGEDFNSLTMFIAAHREFFPAIFTPLVLFFRPGAFAASILGMEILPFSPLPHHVLNFILALTAVWIMYRILLRLTDSLPCRLIGISLFSVSKVHISVVGLINLIEVAVPLLCSLTTFLGLIRFFQGSRKVDYVISIIFFTVYIFSRDSNVVLIMLIVFMFGVNAWQIEDQNQKSFLRAAVLLLPFIAVTLLYLVIRLSLVGLPPVDTGNYSLHLGVDHILSGLLYFGGNLANVSLNKPHLVGWGDLFSVFVGKKAYIYQIALTILVLFALAMASISIRRDLTPAVPLLWALLVLFPTLLVGNQHIYYALEPIAAMSIFLACAMGGYKPSVQRRQVVVWTVLLTLIAANGIISSQYVDRYWWRRAADTVKEINSQIFREHYGEPVTALTIVVSDKGTADLLKFYVNPMGHLVPGRVPLVNALMSSSVESFHAVPFSEFSLDAIGDTEDQLVYRANKTDESYTNLTERTVDIESIHADSKLHFGHVTKLMRESAGGRRSTDSFGPRAMTINLGADTTLSSVRLYNPADWRIGRLEIRVLTDKNWKTVFEQDNLQDQDIINATWPDITAKAVQLLIKSSFHEGKPIDAAAVEKIEFPENRRANSVKSQ